MSQVSQSVETQREKKKKARNDDESQGKTIAFFLDGYLYAQTVSGGAAGCGLSTKEVLGKGACHGFTYVVTMRKKRCNEPAGRRSD